MKVLVDTCVIIDLLQKRTPFFYNAYSIFIGLANYQFEGFITAKSVADIYYLMHHFLHDVTKTRKELDKLFKLFSVLDTTELDCKKALHSNLSDYEDALMVETALRCKVDCILTRNTKDFSKASIKMYSPEEFVNEFLS